MSVKFMVALVATLAILAGCNGGEGNDESSNLDPIAAEGQEAYEARCAQCHGQDLRGTQTGPPFLHEIYAPDHHPDESFFNAVQNGVQPHHWEFGPMPPINGVSREEIATIVAYVRAVQDREGLEGADH